MYRKCRRNRNTWYRKPRFMNRKRKEEWLAPGIEHKLETHIQLINKIKTHANDAFIIAGGSTQKRTPLFMVSQRRRNNRCLQLNRKSFKPSIRRRRYSLQLGAPVIFQKDEWNVVGIHSVGKQVIIKKGGKKMDVNVKKVKLRSSGKGLKFNIQFIPLPKGWGTLEVS